MWVLMEEFLQNPPNLAAYGTSPTPRTPSERRKKKKAILLPYWALQLF